MERTLNLNNIDLTNTKFVNHLINSVTDDVIDNEPEVISELYKLQKILNGEINLIEKEKEMIDKYSKMFVNVSYENRDVAKNRSYKWDPSAKSWYTYSSNN